MNILVTGGAGYIGSHTCKALAQAGHTPVVYDNLSRGFKHAVKWGPLVQADLHDTKTLVRTLEDHKISAVIHFAAFAFVGESTKDPGAYFQNNCGGTLNLLQAMNSVGVKKIVFSSTCATYGSPDRLPIVESNQTAPINPYGRSKLISEWMIRDYQVAHQFQPVILRYFNASGCDPDGEIGENHVPETHLIPLALQAAIFGNTLDVFGSDYPTKDGSCIRDYIHVCDLAQAHILSLNFLERCGPGTNLFNLGNGNGYSVFEVIDTVERVTKKTISKSIQGRREGDPAVLVADAHNAKSQLQWNPKHSDLATIIEHAYRWELQKSKR